MTARTTLTLVNRPSVSHRRALVAWTLCCVLAGLVFLTYALASLAAGRGQYTMPLDDVYIHFQYAHQIAAGQPYVYNPGLPPTSGATSFLYPYLLAVGDLIGFKGLNLGIWAMGLGAVALALSGWIVFRFALTFEAPFWLAALTAALFEVSGPVSWHFMSGMETGLVVLFTLLTLYAFVSRRLSWTIAGAELIALIRPEGAILTVLVVAALALRLWRGPRVGWGRLPWLFAPLLAIIVQPLVNRAVTGSFVASGNAAKSIFGIVPFYLDYVVMRVLQNAGEMLLEIGAGISPREGVYFPFLLSLLALVGLGALLWRKHWRLAGAVVVLWLIGTALAISTLDTAFWHFKRYQMPLIAVVFPLAALGATRVNLRGFRLGAVVMVLAALLSLPPALDFLRSYALNVDYVYLQPLAMARWLNANTLPNAVVAVHDTGSLRYVGDRTTIDIVGLTTPGAADWWRNGPGAVAQFLVRMRPDYIASYGRGHGYGLGYLADTDLYKTVLGFYPVTLDNQKNVALAADSQGIYQPDWTAADLARQGALQPSIRAYVGAAAPLAALDVADVIAERADNYRWSNRQRLGGFPTDVYEMDYVGCILASCRVMDGGRHINGEEAFTLRVGDDGGDTDLVLVTRIHPVNAGTLAISVDGTPVGTRVIPALPGSWLEIATLIPKALVRPTMAIQIAADTPGGYYMPYYHWLFAADYDPSLPSTVPLATFPNGAALYSATPQLDPQTHQLALHLLWGSDGTAQGDYKVFVHVLNSDSQTVAQADVRPGGNTLPPGNWLRGPLSDTIMVDLSQAPPGQYRLALGLYDPLSQARLASSGGDTAQGLIVGTVEIGTNG